jgi:ABC-type transporter Mla subunit MlaD
MPNYQRKEIVPGLFVVAAAVVFGLYAFRVGRWEILDFLKGSRLGCRAVFDEVKTLGVGARVVVAGRRVGAVNRLQWTERPYGQDDIDHLRRQLGALPEGIEVGTRRLVVEVDFELTDASLRLDPASALVAIQQDGLLGQHYVDLYPGFWADGREPAPILAAGHAEPLVLRTRRATGIEQLAATAGDAVASVDSLIALLRDDVLDPANRDNLRALLAGLREGVGELQRLLAEGGELREGTLRPLQRLIESAGAAVADVRENTLPRTDRLLDESRAGVQELRSTLASAHADLAKVLEQLEGALLDTRPELADSVQRLRGTLWQAEMAMRKIRANPALLLFGSAEQDLEARTIDETGTRASGRAQIYRQRDERADGK